MQQLLRDGAALAYEDAGSGAPALLFVHGWGCDHTFFAPQTAYFRHRHRTIAVDLRGFGASDKPHQDYTPAVFAEDLAWLCGQLAVEQPVVIGHSLGGLVALTLAMRYSYLPAAIVMLDMPTALLAGPIPPTDPHWQTIADLRGPGWREAARQYAATMFLPTDDPALRATIVDTMSAGPPHVLASSLACAWSCDLVSIAAACALPALYIQSGIPRPELEHLRQLCPQLILGRTVGAGHFHQLEVPDQINSMLARFLAVFGCRPPE